MPFMELCVMQELAEQYDISVVPTFVAFKGEDKASSFTQESYIDF